MQHHGAPTRLLDFTYSLYVAAYFATEEAEQDCAIWAVDGCWLRRQASEILRANGKRRETTDRMFARFQKEKDEKIVRELFFCEPYVPVASSINPFRLNARLHIQQGVFLIPGDVSRTFVENLDAIPDANPDRFIKIMIPVALVPDARKHLFSMSISRTSLFPGLDGYARSLGIYSPALEQPFEW
jgi:FRG domain